MVSVRTLWMMMWAALMFMVLGCGFAIRSNDRLVGRFDDPAPVAAHVFRDSWMDAARMGAPIYRTEGGPVSLPILPAGKAIVLANNGYALATDDLTDVQRWYGLLTYPVLDLSGFPAVRYVYEIEGAELVTEPDGRTVLMISVHETRTGCERPACDPVKQLPNYDRRYIVKPDNVTMVSAGGNHA